MLIFIEPQCVLTDCLQHRLNRPFAALKKAGGKVFKLRTHYKSMGGKKLSGTGEPRVRGPPLLEEKPEEAVSWDTDVMDFLALAGWKHYRWSPLYEGADSDLQLKLQKRYQSTQSRMDRGSRYAAARFASSVLYSYLDKDLLSLGDLRLLIGHAGTALDGMGENGLREFNHALQKVGLDEIEVGTVYGCRKRVRLYGAGELLRELRSN